MKNWILFFYAIESNGGIKKTMNPKSANKAGNFFFKVQLWIILRFCTQAAFMFKQTDSKKKKEETFVWIICF